MKFVVPGRPVPKLRHRWGRTIVYTPKKVREYEERVGWCAREAGVKLAPGPFLVQIDLYLHGGRVGDVDNYAKSILDALNGVAWEDDEAVKRIEVERFTANSKKEQRAEITILRANQRWRKEGVS